MDRNANYHCKPRKYWLSTALAGCGVLRCCTGGRRSTLLGNYLFIHYRCLPESLLSETIAAKLNSFMIIMSLKFVDMDCNENLVALCDQKMIFLVTVSSRLVAANWGKTRPQSQIIAVASTELQNIKYTITMETWLKWLKLYREKMETSWHDKSFLFYLQSTFYNSVDIS